MEDETRAFLILIINSMAYVLLWMMVNVLMRVAVMITDMFTVCWQG